MRRIRLGGREKQAKVLDGLHLGSVADNDNVAAPVGMAIAKEASLHGLFDWVVCDSALGRGCGAPGLGAGCGVSILFVSAVLRTRAAQISTMFLRVVKAEAGLKTEFAKVAAVATTLVPAAAMATEGTNEILGIDTAAIPLLGLPVLLVANLAFNDWAKTQDNEDFFDELPPGPK